MSAIFGCVYLDGRPISFEIGTRMSQTMEGWGPDGIFTLSEGSTLVGFAGLAVEPDSLHEVMPLVNQEPPGLFTAAARLDNREELCDVFGIPGSERETVPNGRLVLKAYCTWGEDCPRRLYGDWSLAAWDSRRHRLFLARDQLGITGLYYYHHPPLFAFASDPEGLFALKDIRRELDERALASYLVLIPPAEKYGTLWRGVRSLLPGSSLTVVSEGLRTTRYWEVRPGMPVNHRSDDDVVAGFLEHYRRAVRVRLRSRRPIGVCLSSGLDSGSVAALAAQELKRQGLGLTAFTSIPAFPSDHLVVPARADEWPLARAVSNRYDNIMHHAVDANEVSPITGIQRAVAIAHRPLHAACNEFWILAIHDAARMRNIGVMLTGQMGNGSVSWSGGRDHIFYLFAHGKWDAGLKAMAQWRKRHGRSWLGAMAQHMVKPPLRLYWRRAKKCAREVVLPWGNYAAVHPDFARRLGLLHAFEAAGRGAAFGEPIRPFEERRLTLVNNGNIAGPFWHRFGAAFGMDVRDPTADLRLLEYCLEVPAEQYVHDGGKRMLIRRAMEGILPQEVQWNTRRGRQAADVAYRVIQHGEEMDTTLHRLSMNPQIAAYLDLDRMRQVWQELRTEQTPQTASRTSTLLLRGIMCGCFIEDAQRLQRPNQ